MRQELYALDLAHLGIDSQFEDAVDAIFRDVIDPHKCRTDRRSIRIDVTVSPEGGESVCASVTAKVTYKLAPPAVPPVTDRFRLRPFPGLTNTLVELDERAAVTQ